MIQALLQIPLVLPLFVALNGHAPHDSTYSCASAPMPGGGDIMLVIDSQAKPIRTLDGGFSWQPIAGAGVQQAVSWDVVWHPELPNPSGGKGLFLIATETGVWSYDIGTSLAYACSDGLLEPDNYILDLDAPAAGSDGPAMAISRSGAVHLLDPISMVWSETYRFSSPALGKRAVVALNPEFDSNAATGPAQTLFSSANGQLAQSFDGGLTWSLSGHFSSPANSSQDWIITSLAIAPNYTTSLNVLLGRVRETSPGPDEGEIWFSHDGASAWMLTKQLGTGVSSLAASPPDASGVTTWFAAGRSYPNFQNYQGTGILRSVDAGLTWSDNGSWQDFQVEDNPGLASGFTRLNLEQSFCFSSNWANDGRMFYGRQEGFFASEDSGIHWFEMQARGEREFRDIDSGVDTNGTPFVVGAGYGTGGVVHDTVNGVAMMLPTYCPMAYQRRVAVSPNFDKDGMMLFAGNVNLLGWHDPRLAASHPSQYRGWRPPPAINPNTGLRDAGFARVVAFSPHFDARVVPNADQTFFWSSFDMPPMRSQDGGITSERLDQMSTGEEVPFATCYAVAPTYDALVNHEDVYAGTENGMVLKLVQDVWTPLIDAGSQIVSIQVDPDWSRPNNPRLFVAHVGPPYLSIIEDLPGGAEINHLGLNLQGKDVWSMAIPDNLATEQKIFVSTWASGVLSLDLTQPTLSWEAVGTNFPPTFAKSITLSKDFENDRMVFAGTQSGVWACKDLPGETWVSMTNRSMRDDMDESISYFSPTAPGNNNPTHFWPWNSRKFLPLPNGLNRFGDGIRYTGRAGDYATTFGFGSTFKLWTIAGPGTGQVTFTAYDWETGLEIATTTEDLGTATSSLEEYGVTLQLPSYSKVKLKVEVETPRSQDVVVLDAFEFID